MTTPDELRPDYPDPPRPPRWGWFEWLSLGLTAVASVIGLLALRGKL